ncbi:hypothetical protein TorRG33x02_030450 [Trema orientale]|uniref:Uncharacterized protein n=1 Tax=Trema orientale TaxID=63057 RepID=A0A2P5FU39_TREOI|nr:hypothetical protein TorRG33x02_030450 [Trema orientale]
MEDQIYSQYAYMMIITLLVETLTHNIKYHNSSMWIYNELINEVGSGGTETSTVPSSISITFFIVGLSDGSSWTHHSATMTNFSTLFISAIASSSFSTKNSSFPPA